MNLILVYFNFCEKVTNLGPIVHKLFIENCYNYCTFMKY